MLFLGEGYHFYFILIPPSLHRCLCGTPLSYNPGSSRPLSGLHLLHSQTLKLQVSLLKQVALGGCPLIPVCLSENARFPLLPRDTCADPGQGRIPHFPHERSPRNAAAQAPKAPVPHACAWTGPPTRPDVSAVPIVLILPLGILAWLLLPKCLDTEKKKKGPRTWLISRPCFLKRYFANVSARILTAEERAAFA